MKLQRAVAVGVFVALVVAFLPFHGLSHSGGADPGNAQSGCTCHGSATSNVRINIQGISEQWTLNTTYNGTLSLEGASEPLPAPVGQNKGGFALESSIGSLATKDGKTQLKGAMLTHTSSGNDDRSWNFQWTSPASGNETSVTFSFAGNAVNGDTKEDILDQWNKGTKMVAGHAESTNQTGNETQPPEAEGSPAPSTLGAILVMAFAVAVAASRRRS